MTTQNTNSNSLPVLTPAGARIPLVGTICFHPSVGFGEVVARSGSRVRIAITDFSFATDVTLLSGGVISREAWLSRVSDASLNAACIEIAALEARGNDKEDALLGATTFIKETCARIEARVRDVNEMVVGIDGAEAFGWEFDEYAMELPKSARKRGKAPAPRQFKAAPSKVGTLEDPCRPDWLVAELNETYGDSWSPNSSTVQS